MHSGSSSKHNRPWCARDTSPGMGRCPPPITPTSAIVWCGARNGRVVMQEVRPPVRPAIRWIRVVSLGAANFLSGRMVVRQSASFDLPALGG